MRISPHALPYFSSTSLSAAGRLIGRALVYLCLLSVGIVAQNVQPETCSCNIALADTLAGSLSKQRGTFKARVTSQRNPTTNEQEWILQAITQIDVTDACAKQRLQDKLNALLNRSLKPLLTAEDPDFIVIPPPSPAADAPASECIFCFLYTPTETGPRLPFKVEIHVTTAAAALPKTPAGAQLNVAAERVCETLGTGGITARLAFAQADLDNARENPQITSVADARNHVIAELRKVAEYAVTTARAKQMLNEMDQPRLGCPNAATSQCGVAGPDPQTVTKAIADALTEQYDLHLLRDSAVGWGPFSAFVTSCNSNLACGIVAETGPATGHCAGLCNQTGPPAPTWIIVVGGLQLVHNVSLDVAPDDLDVQYTRTATGRSLKKERDKVERELRKKFLPALQAQDGHIITRPIVECDQKKLCSGDPQIGCETAMPARCQGIRTLKGIRSRPYLPPGSQKPPPLAPRLSYEVWRELPPEKAIGLNFSASYAPEEKFLGGIALDEHNLLGISEDLTLNFARGPEVQRTQFKFVRPFQNEAERRFFIKELSANVQYFRDRNLRLSNLTEEEIEAREVGSAAKFAFGYDSFLKGDQQAVELLKDQRPRTRLTFLADLGLAYRDVNIPDSDKLLTITRLSRSLLPLARTQITNFAFNLTASLSHDFRRADLPGLGFVSLTLSTQLQHGLDWFGADYDYGKAQLRVSGETLFGPSTAQDFLLRYTQGIARASAATPVFELFRLGGTQNLRGMEEGEFIGRRLSFGQAEFGVNVVSLAHWLRPPKPADTDTTAPDPAKNQEKQSAGPDLSRIYLKAFFDHARITDPTSFNAPLVGGLPGFKLDRRANGYGFAVEMRGLPVGEGGQTINLSIGYGRSPQSNLHRSGTLFSAVGLNF